jgi:hypothetical protein
MSMQDVLAEALALPTEERAELIGQGALSSSRPRRRISRRPRHDAERPMGSA